MADQEPLDLAACRTDIARAHTEVGDIAHDGYRRWRMSIPAQPNRDSDLLISKALTHGERLADEVERLQAEVARLRAGEDDERPDPGTALTPAQWIRKWNDAAPDRRLHAAERVLQVIDQESRCFQQDHDGRLEHAEGELSARRDHETRWELERQRANGAEAEVDRLLAELEEAQIEIASWRLARSQLGRWWEWPLVQWWWYRQYKRRDRKAFKRECEEIRDRAARGDQ